MDVIVTRWGSDRFIVVSLWWDSYCSAQECSPEFLILYRASWKACGFPGPVMLNHTKNIEVRSPSPASSYPINVSTCSGG